MTIFASTFEEFLLWERSSRDTLEVKRIYIDMAGDLVAGVVLSQIVYWHLPSREGKARLQVENDGDLWLAKGRAEWWEECRISPKQADRALDVLQERGIIEVRLFKFGIAPTKHIRLIHEAFLQAWREHLVEGGGGQPPPSQTKPDFYQRSKSISTKGKNPFSPKVKMDLPQRVKSLDTETTTETTTASASARGELPTSSGPAADAAADSLAEELVSHGVGRTTAERLAREKPGVCRRCLEYLPYAKLKTTKGAWLANAIRDEYGPPRGFEEAKAREIREAQARQRTDHQKSRQVNEDAIRQRNQARVGERYRQMEKEHGGVFLAFTAYLEKERTKAMRVTAHLSPARKKEHLDTFDTPERRLELFEQWLNSEGNRRDLVRGPIAPPGQSSLSSGPGACQVAS